MKPYRMLNLSEEIFNTLWVSAMMLLLVVQYVRPQGMIPALELLHPFLLASGCLFGFMLLSGKSVLQTGYSQIRLVWLFTIWMFILLPFAEFKSYAAKGMYDYMILLPFVLSTVMLINDTKRLRQMVDAFVLVMLFVGIRGYIAREGDFKGAMFGVGNFLEDPNDFALYMNTMLPICYFMFMYESRIWKKAFYAVGVFVSFTSIIVSFSRGGLLALLCVAFIIWAFSPNKKLTTSIAGVMLLGVLIFGSSQWKQVATTAFDPNQSTAQTRLITWKLSAMMFTDNIMGIGINNTPGVMHRYAKPWEQPRRWWGNVSHSFWLTALAEGGIIGFLIVMTLLTANTLDCLRMGRLKPTNDDARFLKYFGYGYLGSLVGFLAAGTFLTVNYYPHLWYMTGMIAAGSGIMFKLKQADVNESSTVYQYN